jgi:hypothetical protein
MRLPATVHKTNGVVVRVTIRNLSSGGAYVELSPDSSILRGVVELELCLPGHDAHLWRAFVLRQQADGAGLMFDDHWSSERLQFLAVQSALQKSRLRTQGEGRLRLAARDS